MSVTLGLYQIYAQFLINIIFYVVSVYRLNHATQSSRPTSDIGLDLYI